MTEERIDPQRILVTLKDFQQRTVEYVFRRMYQDPKPTRRFLIADEVGLGKTLVARGIVAKAIEHLWDKVRRIDVVYICSNSDIARQNINRLNVTGQRDFALASRITLLPIVLGERGMDTKLNFVSFTPGTSFDLKSSLGIVRERALLFRLLEEPWRLRGKAPVNVLKGNAGSASFRYSLKHLSESHHIDDAIYRKFSETVAGKDDIRQRFLRLCEHYPRWDSRTSWETQEERNRVIGQLRGLLARTCLESLQPDLIILDEFQRFKHLLDGDSEAAQLARDLFDYCDETSEARVLLLSATPYKMYTLAQENSDDDHYVDFMRTVKFLLNDSKEAEAFESCLNDYRRELYRIGDGGTEKLMKVKADLESRLRQVMVRTERLASTVDRNGMLVEVPPEGLHLHTRDVHDYVALQALARDLEHHDILEYWKSAPYLLNFMEDYEFKERLLENLDDPSRCDRASKLLSACSPALLNRQEVEKYAQLDPSNARMRELLARTVYRGAWKLLWVPPSLTYYQPEEPFADPKLQGFTKKLVFSCWKVVPKAIAVLASYEAERQMILSLNPEASNTPDARKKRRRLLQFARSDGRLTAMPILALIYPCAALCRFDPLLARYISHDGQMVPTSRMLEVVRKQLEKMLEPFVRKSEPTSPPDESWYWAAPLLLDLSYDKTATLQWFDQEGLAQRWAGIEEENGARAADEGDEPSRWADHVAQARALLKGEIRLGTPPPNLCDVAAQMAISAPGVTALRAISRVVGGSSAWRNPDIRNAAARLSYGFLTLFNQPEVTAMIRGRNPQEPYWQRVLEYCRAGNIQSMLDEYVHVLRESLGLFSSETKETADEIADAVIDALSLRTTTLGVDVFRTQGSRMEMDEDSPRMRARFAMRFGQDKQEDTEGTTRADQVRGAFNSPFWPFVLATTSVGQEGLDFHTYCHAVVHWNLPSNPVDLEQREGRVHRYKGHAVRKNVAAAHEAVAGHKKFGDPWGVMFDAARAARTDQASDLIPYWVTQNSDAARIERHVPAFRLSEDSEHYELLCRSLAVYRMAFGQNRQEDLVRFLMTQIKLNEIGRVGDQLRIDLSPP